MYVYQPSVPVCVCALHCMLMHVCTCLFVQKEKSPDLLESCRTLNPPLPDTPVTATICWMEPLGEVTRHLGKGEEK